MKLDGWSANRNDVNVNDNGNSIVMCSIEDDVLLDMLYYIIS
jgi:hypothetical protein